VALVLDIGTKIIADLSRVIHGARTVVFNGPAGVFEDTDFATGTFEIIKAASQVEFSFIGGSYTAAVVENLCLNSHFTHISTGGGAFIEFLTGRKLPAVEALEQSKTVFG
jgi:phosphoglycerate kinase